MYGRNMKHENDTTATCIDISIHVQVMRCIMNFAWCEVSYFPSGLTWNREAVQFQVHGAEDPPSL